MRRPKPIKLWVNVYRPLNGAMGSVWESRALADQMAGRGRLACIEIEAPGTLEEALRAHRMNGGGKS